MYRSRKTCNTQIMHYIYRFHKDMAGMFLLIRLHADNTVPDSWISRKKVRKRNNHRHTCNRSICLWLNTVFLMDTSPLSLYRRVNYLDAFILWRWEQRIALKRRKTRMKLEYATTNYNLKSLTDFRILHLVCG